MTLKSELVAWCQSYVSAFNAEDAEAIAAHWTFPALTTQAGRSFTFKSAEHFARNTGSLLGFYRAQDVAKVERSVSACQLLHRDAVSMTVSLSTMMTPMLLCRELYICNSCLTSQAFNRPLAMKLSCK